MTLTLTEFLNLRANPPKKLTPLQAQAVRNAADWGILQAPIVDASLTEKFGEMVELWAKEHPDVQAVRDRFGGWQIGSIAGSPGLVIKALQEAIAKPA